MDAAPAAASAFCCSSDTYAAPVRRICIQAFRKVVEPLNGLDLEHPDENDAYDEVQPLLSKISRQSRQIRLQLEAARRQQKEFSIITENMQEGLLVIDRYTMVLSVNSSVGKLLKVKGDQNRRKCISSEPLGGVSRCRWAGP